MRNRKILNVQIPTATVKQLRDALGSRKDTYHELLKNVQPSTVAPLDDDKLNPSLQNRQEVERDKAVTSLLKEYVNAYKTRQSDNRKFREQMFNLCRYAVGGLIATIIGSIVYAFICTERDVNDIVALVTACISSIGSIAFLLDIIAKYVFPKNEEDHIAQMVQSVQRNDLEERKLRYEHQKMLNEALKQNPPVDRNTEA